MCGLKDIVYSCGKNNAGGQHAARLFRDHEQMGFRANINIAGVFSVLLC